MSSRQVVIPRFQIVRKGKTLKVVPVNRKLLVVGREEGAHLRLKHPKLAGRHLEIRVVEGRYLEAMNVAGVGQVQLNGEDMDRARLREGDELNLGPVILKLTYKRTGMTVADQSVHEATLPREDTVDEISPPTSSSAEGVEDESTVIGQSGDMDELRERAAALEREDSLAYTDAPTAEVPAYVAKEQAPDDLGMPSDEEQAADSHAVAALPDTDLASSQPGVTPVPDIPAHPTLDGPTFDDIVLDPVPVVLIEPPGGRPQRVSLRVGSFVLGSGRCAFRLSYPGIAPAHAELMVMPDGALYLKHLAGPELRTLRNGAPIQFSRWNPGDRLQIGPVAIGIELEGETPQTTEEAEGDTFGEIAAASEVIEGDEQLLEPESRVDDVPEVGETAPMPLAAESSHSGLMSARIAPEDSASAPPPKKKAKEPKKKSVDVFEDYREDDVGYQRPIAQRMLMPALFLLAIGSALFFGWEQIEPHLSSFTGDKSEATEEPIVVKRASGESGVSNAATGAQAVGSGPLSIGERGKAAKGGGAWGDPGIDWDNRERMKFGGGKPYQTDHSQKRDYGKDADSIEAMKAGSGSAVVIGGGGASATTSATAGASAGTSSPSPSAPSGPADLSEVKSLIYSNQRMLRQCYTQLRVDDPTLGGTMWLEMKLGDDQRLRNVTVQARSSLKNEELRSCLERRLFSLKVPSPPGGPHTVVVPLEFAVSE